MKPKVQKSIILILCAGMCALLIIFNSTAMDAARDGFELWLTSVMPALFPFFVLTSVMSEAGLLRLVSAGKRGRMGFTGALGLFAVSMISGSPCGAKLSSMLHDGGMIDDARATRIAAACNMLSPMFIVGSLGAWLGSVEAAMAIAIGHYTASFTALLFAVYSKKGGAISGAGGISRASAFRPLPALSRALSDGTMNMVKICGTIVFFMVISRLMDAMGVFSALAAPFAQVGVDGDIVSALVMGGFEAVGGAAAAAGASSAALGVKCACSAFIITFGGVCILAQSIPFVKVKASSYLLQKLLTGILAGIIAYAAAMCILPDSVVTIGEIAEDADVILKNAQSAAGIFVSSVLGMGAVGIFGFILRRRNTGNGR